MSSDKKDKLDIFKNVPKNIFHLQIINGFRNK